MNTATAPLATTTIPATTPTPAVVRPTGTPRADAVIEVEGLTKSFGDVRALDGVGFAVRRGTVLGLLGPNGSGKTTSVRVLTTLLRPDGGRASVLGHDVTAEPAAVRRRIGLTGQYAAVDEALTGTDNLMLIARLMDLSRRDARTRTRELIERFGLEDAARRRVRTYSGGMRRRLDLAASLIGRPDVLFLDEPTTGLDPRHRNEVWEAVRALADEGVTVLLTTQYLEEADQLAHDLVVLDHGKVIAGGTAASLKARVGGRRLHVRPMEPADLAAATRVVADLVGVEPTVDATGGITAPAPDGGVLLRAESRLAGEGVAVSEIGLRLPSLDDVFLDLTGRSTATEESAR